MQRMCRAVVAAQSISTMAMAEVVWTADHQWEDTHTVINQLAGECATFNHTMQESVTVLGGLQTAEHQVRDSHGPSGQAWADSAQGY